MKIANFRESHWLEVGQTSRSVQQATGQEAGPTRKQPAPPNASLRDGFSDLGG